MVKRHRTGDLDPTDFGGRYTLLRRLAIGGMAEIYLARQAAAAGFEKEIVIKRLRAELAEDPRIVEMFLDEAKIGAQLNHPNVVHVYDVDVHDGIPYIAMEYIVGEELNELCRRGITLGRFLPLEHAVELVRQAAAGMGYFHAKRTNEGRPLEIVHLDISPSNLLVTQDGFMKVIDFGIARAKGHNSRHEVLPGKLSYMSPEQAARKDVDHRSDIFSLGIVLYEITVGKRLFRGPAAEVVPRLVEAKVEPPTFTRRSFPPALESIVMRALEKHPEDRYQSAYDLADDLEAFLRDDRLHSGPVRIARYLDMLAILAGGQRRPELVSEAEARRESGDELDFDSGTFDGFVPGIVEPGGIAAWEDVEQPESEIAAALHLELAELRALRTPVPTRPSGMMPVTGAGNVVEDEVATTTKVPRMSTSEIEGDDDGYDDAMTSVANPALPEPPTQPVKTPKPLPLRPPAATEPLPTTPRPEARSPRPEATPIPIADGPSLGAAMLARKSGSAIWIWLVVLLVAALGSVAYIVTK